MPTNLYKRSACLTVLTAMIILIFFCLMPATSWAAVRNFQETVRVGIFPLGNFQNIDEDGDIYGYNIDYLDTIARYTHWNYEYVICNNWVEATQLLESGSIDLLAPAQKIEDLENRFDYTVYTMGTEFAAIYVLDKREDLLFEDFNTMAKLKYGGARNSTFTSKFEAVYSKNAGFTPDISYYPNTSTLFQALETEEVDAIVTNIMFAEKGLKLLGRFSPLPVYYITQKGNSSLLEQLDDAMTTIRLQNPSLEAELMSEYFPLYNNTQYTYEELKYIKAAPEILVGYEQNYEPLSYQDSNGEFAGIIRNILDEIGEYTNFTFRYVPLPGKGVTREMLEEKGIHVLAGLDSMTGKEYDSTINLTTPYLETDKVVVVKQGTKFDEHAALTLAVNDGHGVAANAVKEVFPNFNILECNSTEACFEAVRKGKADALLQNRYVVEPWLSKPVNKQMSVIPVQSLQETLSIAVLGNVVEEDINSDMFLKIMDKAVKQLPAKQINSIVIHNTMENRYQMTLGDVLYQYRYTLVVIAVLVLVCMALILHEQSVKANKNEELSEKNNQLIEAINQAEHANSSKSQFLSRMSHEIRTPMNAVVGLTAIARIHKEDPNLVEDYLDKIDSSSKVLLSIINDVLDMSAIESNKLKIAHSQFDIKTVLTSISTIYYSQCRQKGLRFVMATDISNELLIGDSLRLNQVLMNLVSNAYKFTEAPGEIRITAKETTRKTNKIFIRFIVADTGVGMSEEMVKRLFKPFEQESVDTASRYGGSGLGLSIAKNLVDMMHGAISVESTKGKGTVFTVDIPFETTGQERITDERELRDIRVLVVDDDQNAREYTSIILNRIGVRYDVATSGQDAIIMLKEAFDNKEGYDICFVDWKMPHMDGVELTKKIRKTFSSDMVIIIVSAFDLSEVEEEAKGAGADLFIPKPMFQSTIFDLLMNLSGGKYTKRSAEECSYNFTGHRVLLAEDHAMNREIAVELLHIVDIDIDCAEDGQKALELFEQSEPGTYDLILMDIQMPVMDGYEATRRIRSSTHPEAVTIPIYAMTANAFTEDVSAALSAGMTGHIAKPIDTALLFKTIQNCVEGNNRK